MNVMYPNYDRSSVSMANSIRKHFGLATHHPTLPELDAYLDKGFESIVMILLDGLGSHLLTQHLPKEALLRKKKVTDISAVFPSATVIATTSIATGLHPIEHGWVGWDIYLANRDQTVTTYLNLDKDTGKQAADYHVIREEFPIKTIVEAINEETAYQGYWISPFEHVTYPQNDPEEMFARIAEKCQETGKKYVYAYCAEPDWWMHLYGVDDERVINNIRFLNDQIETLANTLENTLIIVTADHGHMNAEPIFLEQYPELTNMLKRTPSIDFRVTTFFVKNGMAEEFATIFNQHFSEDFKLFTKEEVLDLKLFGHGTPNEKFSGTIGDFLAVGIGNKYIKEAYEKNPLEGHHGGLTKEEMTVPLIVIET